MVKSCKVNFIFAIIYFEIVRPKFKFTCYARFYFYICLPPLEVSHIIRATVNLSNPGTCVLPLSKKKIIEPEAFVRLYYTARHSEIASSFFFPFIYFFPFSPRGGYYFITIRAQVSRERLGKWTIWRLGTYIARMTVKPKLSHYAHAAHRISNERGEIIFTMRLKLFKTCEVFAIKLAFDEEITIFSGRTHQNVNICTWSPRD